MDYIAHHGIPGQKWGQRNGPPYPLNPGAHSAAEKRAGSTKYGHTETSYAGSSVKGKVGSDGYNSRYTISSKCDLNSLGFYQKKADASLEEDCKATNPLYWTRAASSEYAMNCADCSITYAFRRMGLDVTATPNALGTPLSFVESTFKNVLNPEHGAMVRLKPEDRDASAARTAVTNECLRLSKNSKTAVGFIGIHGKRHGHMFSWEKTSSGKIVFVDAQRNHVNDSVIDKYFDIISRGKRGMAREARVSRLDNISSIDERRVKVFTANVKRREK